MKIAKNIAGSVVASAAKKSLGGVSLKVKEEVEKKVSSYKKKFAFLALELGFLVLGVNFFVLGIIELISKKYPVEYVLLLVGFILILVGLFFGKKIHSKN